MTTPEARAAREKRLTRRITVVMWATFGLLTILVLLAPPVINASRNSNDSKRTDEIAACRSVANSDLNEARTDRSETARVEERARNQLIRLQVEATEVAIFEEDPGRLLGIREDLASARIALAEAETATDQATAEERNQNDVYRDLSQQSLEDPDAFLASCKGRS